MNTLLLDQTLWDLCTDAAGNIAMAQEPYAIAQDAASACRTFRGEVWYDNALGVPYFQQVLGQALSLPQLRAQLEGAARSVPDVVSARVFFTGIEARRVQGQVQVTTSEGVTLPIAL